MFIWGWSACELFFHYHFCFCFVKMDSSKGKRNDKSIYHLIKTFWCEINWWICRQEQNRFLFISVLKGRWIKTILPLPPQKNIIQEHLEAIVIERDNKIKRAQEKREINEKLHDQWREMVKSGVAQVLWYWKLNYSTLFTCDIQALCNNVENCVNNT